MPDLNRIAELMSEEKWSLNAELLARLEDAGVVIECDPNYEWAYIYLLSPDGTTAYISNVVVRKDLRHQGIGTRLMQELEDKLRGMGIKRVFGEASGTGDFWQRIGASSTLQGYWIVKELH